MYARIQFSWATVKELGAVWQRALRRGERRVVERVSALLLLADGQPVAVVAERLGRGQATIYAWLRTFMADRLASLVYRRSPGRPPKLTPSQKQRLSALVSAGPEAAG